MISLKPRSILQLTVTGFLIVSGLLVIALLITAQQLDGLSGQGQRIVNQSATAMSAGRTIIEQASSMERNAGQFEVLQDEELLTYYAVRREIFVESAMELRSLQLGLEIDNSVTELLGTEEKAYATVTNQGEESALQSGNMYPQLTERAYRISTAISEWTNQQLAELQEETENTKSLLTIEALVLVIAALAIAGIFTALITSPLLQIEKAIGQLGSGSYNEAINITGPRDLVSLGGRLDWLRSRLNKLEQQRSSFLRHVSHELKTPLTAIQESASLLSDGLVGSLNGEQQDIIRIQNSNCQRLRALIDDLLQYNLESFSVLNSMPEPVRLDKMVNTVIQAHELIIKSSGLILELDLARLIVNGDNEQIRVVFDNLLANAIKYSPENGTITINLYQQDGNALFEITDQGPGIKAEEADKIFEAFYQGEAPERKIYLGSGLGLAITQEYVNANAGMISVINHSSGARFRVQFPMAEQAHEQVRLLKQVS